VEREVAFFVMPFSNQLDAKQFLVDKIVSQVQIQGVPLSDIDRRMLLFSVDEPESAIGIPLEVLEDVSQVYEAKIIKLLKSAYKQDSDNPEERQKYRDAMRTLKGSDHYILVMASAALPKNGIGVSRLTWIGILIAIVIIVYVMLRK
jgi:hypothetical protein